MDRMKGPTEEPEAKFEAEERPTNPSAPAPEELAMHTWLASEIRAIGARHSSTSRFRAVAVAAVEGGVARVSHVDVLEANAKTVTNEQPEPSPAAPTPEPVTPAPVTAAPVTAAPVTAAPVTAAPETPAPVEKVPPARPPLRLGPRGTVRIAVRDDRGPTGTVRMRRSALAAGTDRDELAERRAARVRRLVVSAFAVLCVFDVAWISIRAAPAPASVPAVSSTALQGGQAAQTEETPAQTSSMEDPQPPATTSSAAEPPPPRHPASPPTKPARKRATTGAGVF